MEETIIVFLSAFIALVVFVAFAKFFSITTRKPNGLAMYLKIQEMLYNDTFSSDMAFVLIHDYDVDPAEAYAYINYAMENNFAFFKQLDL